MGLLNALNLKASAYPISFFALKEVPQIASALQSAREAVRRRFYCGANKYDVMMRSATKIMVCSVSRDGYICLNPDILLCNSWHAITFVPIMNDMPWINLQLQEVLILPLAVFC